MHVYRAECRGRSVLPRHHDRDHRLGPVSGPADGLELDELLPSFVHEEIAFEHKQGSRGTPGGGAEHPEEVPQPAIFALTEGAGDFAWYDKFVPYLAGNGDRIFDPGLARHV